MRNANYIHDQERRYNLILSGPSKAKSGNGLDLHNYIS